MTRITPLKPLDGFSPASNACHREQEHLRPPEIPAVLPFFPKGALLRLMTKHHRFLRNTLLGLFAATIFACADQATHPSNPAASGAATATTEVGSVSTSAVTLQRIRLRRVNGPDIVTALVDGQVIDVPVNLLIDVWAEVRYESTDAVPRLSVDWNMDAPGGDRDNVHCGPCRIEKTYGAPGRYRVRATVDDRAGGLISRTVTLNVQAPPPTPTPTPTPGAPAPPPAGCTPVGSDFDSFPNATPLPVAIPGIALTSGPGAGVYDIGSFKFVDGRGLWPGSMSGGTGVDIALASDHTSLSVAFAVASFNMVTLGATYKAFDAADNLVATGTVAPTSFGQTTVGGETMYEGTLAFSGILFRKLQIRAPNNPYAPGYFVLDHLVIGCN